MVLGRSIWRRQEKWGWCSRLGHEGGGAEYEENEDINGFEKQKNEENEWQCFDANLQLSKGSGRSGGSAHGVRVRVRGLHNSHPTAPTGHRPLFFASTPLAYLALPQMDAPDAGLPVTRGRRAQRAIRRKGRRIL